MKIRGIRVHALMEDGSEKVLWKRAAETPAEAILFAVDSHMRGMERVRIDFIGECKPLLRCVVTKNLCGTDTWAADTVCSCTNCKTYMEARGHGSAPTV